MKQETSRLHWGPGSGRCFGETKSLRQAAENPQFNQHQNVLFSLRGAPSQKAESMAICQAKRSAQTLWNYKNNIPNSSHSLKHPIWVTSAQPLCSPWTPFLLNIPHSLLTHHSLCHDNFFLLNSHELLGGKGKINIQENENIKFPKSLPQQNIWPECKWCDYFSPWDFSSPFTWFLLKSQSQNRSVLNCGDYQGLIFWLKLLITLLPWSSRQALWKCFIHWQIYVVHPKQGT